jgi:hypothetical protein
MTVGTVGSQADGGNGAPEARRAAPTARCDGVLSWRHESGQTVDRYFQLTK